MEQAKARSSKEILGRLQELFPQVFVREKPYKPLKVGIYQDVKNAMNERAEPMSLREIRSAISLYCRNRHYYKACSSGAKRIDLQGNICGEVNDDEAVYAKQKLDSLKEQYVKRLKEQHKQAVKKLHKFARRAVASQGDKHVMPMSREELALGMNLRVKVGSNYQKAVLVEIVNKQTALVECFGKIKLSLPIDKLFRG